MRRSALQENHIHCPLCRATSSLAVRPPILSDLGALLASCQSPSVLLTGLYPFGKRFAHYPQIILGSVFSWGVIMAFPALEVDLWARSEKIMAAASLYMSCIAWTMSYDTIYAAQDIKDDLKVGVKSPVVRHQSQTRMLLFGAVLTQILLLICIGVVSHASGIYFLCTCVCASIVLRRETMSVDLTDPENCLWWFKKGCLYTGLVISGGFYWEYTMKIDWGNVAGSSGV